MKGEKPDRIKVGRIYHMGIPTASGYSMLHALGLLLTIGEEINNPNARPEDIKAFGRQCLVKVLKDNGEMSDETKSEFLLIKEATDKEVRLFKKIAIREAQLRIARAIKLLFMPHSPHR